MILPGRPSLSMPHSPYYFFRGGVNDSLMPSLHLCIHVCGECWRVFNWSVVQGWTSTSSSLCLVTGNNTNTDNLHVPTSPFCRAKKPYFTKWPYFGHLFWISSNFFIFHRNKFLPFMSMNSEDFLPTSSKKWTQIQTSRRQKYFTGHLVWWRAIFHRTESKFAGTEKF